MQPEKIIIKRHLGMGDCAFAAAAATALKQEKPHIQIWFDAPRRRMEWLLTCPIFEKTCPPKNASVFDLDAVSIENDEDRSLIMARTLGVDDFHGAPLELEIPLNPGWKKFICFVPYCAGYAATRSLTSSEVGRFIRLLNQPIVLMHGQKISVFDPPKGIVGAFQTTEYEAVRIALSCSAVVGMDSGIPHVTALCGKRTVIAFSHISPSSRVKFVGNHLSVVQSLPARTHCPCGEFQQKPPCYNTEFFSDCTKNMTAEMLISALDEKDPVSSARFPPH